MVGKFPDDRRSEWTELVAANRVRRGLNRPSRLELAAAPRRFDRRLADVAGFDPDSRRRQTDLLVREGPDIDDS